MNALLVGYLAAVVVSLLHVALTVMASQRLGARVQTARVFSGPAVLRRTLGGVGVELGAIPIPSSFVAFVPLDEPDGTSAGDVAPASGRTTLDQISRIRRVVVVLLPWLIIAALTMPFLGPIGAWESLARGLVQVVHGALQPFDVGAALLARSFDTFRSMGAVGFGAAVVSKIVAFNLLPLFGTAGQQAVHRGFTDRPLPPRWLSLVSATMGLFLLIGWSIAIYAYVAS